jgi:outer membrane biosynthesis protein TonB
MNDNNKNGKVRGWITTAVVHTVLLLLMFVLGFSYMVPPKGDIAIGFEALGEEDAGKTTEAATSEKVAPQQQDATTPPEESSSDPVKDNFATQDESPVNVSDNTTKVKPKDTKPKDTKPKDTEPVKQDPTKKVDDKLKDLLNSMKGADNDGGSGSNNKDGNQGGDKGVTDGDGQGGSGVDGMFDFGGRKAIKPGNLNHDCGVSGRVKVRVKVDRAGYVIDAEAVGGTTSNQCLRNKAIKEAKATKYSENPTGPVYQEGFIELYFQLK